jgi:hypothetical protein
MHSTVHSVTEWLTPPSSYYGEDGLKISNFLGLRLVLDAEACPSSNTAIKFGCQWCLCNKSRIPPRLVLIRKLAESTTFSIIPSGYSEIFTDRNASYTWRWRNKKQQLILLVTHIPNIKWGMTGKQKLHFTCSRCVYRVPMTQKGMCYLSRVSWILKKAVCVFRSWGISHLMQRIQCFIRNASNMERMKRIIWKAPS